MPRRHIRWSNLRLMGNAPVVRLTILIPVVGYFILLNVNIAEAIKTQPSAKKMLP